MKISYLFIALLLLNITKLQAQNLPLQSQNIPFQVQKKLNFHQNQQHQLLGMQDRNHVPDCLPDTIKYFKYTSSTDSILESFNVYEISSDVNGYTNTGYSINQSTGNIYLSSNYVVELNDQNKEVYIEQIFYSETGSELFGNKGLVFYNPTTFKVDSSITFNRDLANQTWEYQRKSVNTYNSNGFVFINTGSVFTVNGWENADRLINAYDSENKLLVQNYATWNGIWMPNLKIKLFYTPNDSLSEVIYLAQPSNDSLHKNVYSYGALNRVDFYRYNFSTMGFVSSGYNVFSRDAQFRNTYSEYLFQGEFYTYAGITSNYYGGGANDCLSLEVSTRSNDGIIYENFKSFYIYNTNSATNLPQNTLEWTIAPNPNDGNFLITASEGAVLTIFNGFGQVIWEKKET
jgi:hypothetical protein